MDQAQSSAVSITQAAAIIVGASAGSSIITLIIILCVLRYRRKKRREREGQAEDARGKMNDDDGSRPGTSGSYNSMTAAPRDLKDQALMTGSTAVAAAPERFQSVRIVDVSRNGSKNSATRVGAGGGGGGAAAAAAATTTTTIKGGAARSKPESFLGERLSRLGITRRPTGEAFTTDYVQRADSVRKPVITLADPPAAAKKDQQQDYGASSKTTPTFSVFPKIDPDPKGTMLKTVREESRPPSSGAALQAWLQTAEISPFGPLEPPPAKTSDNNNEPTSKGAPGPARLTEVKWPLQDRSSAGGVKRSATDASSRYSTQTETAPEQGNIPVALVRDNPAAGTPQVVPGRMKGPGLPGSVRKVTTSGSVRDVSALGRDQRLGG